MVSTGSRHPWRRGDGSGVVFHPFDTTTATEDDEHDTIDAAS